jgi:two-component system sensor kinase FixL
MLPLALGLFIGVAWLHWRFPGVPLGFVYLFPMLPAALVLNRWQVILFGIALAATRSSILAEEAPGDAVLRFLLALIAYWATGLLVIEMSSNRTLRIKHTEEISEQQRLLQQAQADLKTLAESSPAAIFTLDDQSRVVSGNQAASSLLGIEPSDLTGYSTRDSLPVLADALKFAPGSTTFRTAAQCQGIRADGERFVAQTWFSTYDSSFGRRLAAIAVDISDEIREREEQNLRQLLTNNRIVAAAVSHEIRNICSAISLVHSRIRQTAPPEHEEDFTALGSLVEALGRVAAMDLQVRARSAMETVDLVQILDQLRIIIGPDWKEADAVLRLNIPRSLPRVFGESYGILQVLMNLSQNSLRAIDLCEDRSFELSISATPHSLLLCVTDSGSGVANPEGLFEPFRSETGHTGIGLYVSRAILRSYGGDLRYDPQPRGATFVLELAIAAANGAQP